MADLLFWMGIILLCGVFGWLVIADILRRDERGEQPFTLLMGVKVFLVVCGVICLSIGRNSFVPENMDSGGDDKQVTVTDKEVKDLESKRSNDGVKKKNAEKKSAKKDDEDLLDDMKKFREGLEKR